MKRTSLWMMAMLMLAAWGLAVRVEARVFRLAGLSRSGGAFDLSAVGKRLYRAAMEVDGREVDVSVIRAEGWGGVLAGLLQGTAGEVSYAGGERMGVGEIRDGDRRLRLLSLPVAGDGSAVVVAVQSAVEPSGADVVKARVIAGVPVYRDAEVKRVLRNEDTGTTLRQAVTADAPGVVMEYYRAMLTREGWRPALPDAAARSASELACYVKGADLCLILCRRMESDGETRVTLVNKRGGLNGTMGDR